MSYNRTDSAIVEHQSWCRLLKFEI